MYRRLKEKPPSKEASSPNTLNSTSLMRSFILILYILNQQCKLPEQCNTMLLATKDNGKNVSVLGEQKRLILDTRMPTRMT